MLTAGNVPVTLPGHDRVVLGVQMQPAGAPSSQAASMRQKTGA